MSERSFVPTATAPWRRDVLLLVLVLGSLYLFALGRLPLANPDEGRYAQIPREMLAAGDWITPTLNWVPYFEKPPLVYWAVGASITLFGPGEFAVRLVPALFALAGTLITYGVGRRIFGRVAGVGAAFVLGTALLYFGLARVLLLDMALTVLIGASLGCFILAVREPAPATDASAGQRRRWLFYGVYAAAALATLAKGLIGFLIPGAVMACWLLLFNQWHRLRPFYLPSGLLVFLAIAAPWHVLAAQRNPEWAEFYFIHEHWRRFTSSEHLRAEPWYFYIVWLPALFFPWSVFLIQSVREAVAGGWSRRQLNADAWFFVVWFAFVLLFFTKSQSKLLTYIFPAFPALAVLVGAWLARRWAEGHAGGMRVGLRVFSFFAGLFAIALVVAVFKPGIIRDAAQASQLRPYAIAMAVILLLGGVVAPAAARARGVVPAVAIMVATMFGFLLTLTLAAPGFQRAATKELALVARAKVKPGDRVFHYWAFFHDFVYYSQIPVGLVNYTDELEHQFLDPKVRAERFIDNAEFRRLWEGAGRIWIVARKRHLQLDGAVLTDPTFRYHLIAETEAHTLLSNQP